MKTNVTKQCVLIPLVISALLAAFFSGCDSSYKSPSKTSDSATNNPASTTNNAAPMTSSVSSAPHSTDVSKVLLGVWKGPAGTDQGETTFNVVAYRYTGDSGGYYTLTSGTVTWQNGDFRYAMNFRYDPPAFNRGFLTKDPNSTGENRTDNWDLTYDGTSLRGTGTKVDTNGNAIAAVYDIFLTRQ